jgi:hypothetical protein
MDAVPESARAIGFDELIVDLGDVEFAAGQPARLIDLIRTLQCAR